MSTRENILLWLRTFEEIEPDISTPRLISMVQDETGAEFDEVMNVLKEGSQDGV